MQAIKTVALREAENTSRRIREQTAWFYLRHMNIDEETKAHAVFNGLLTRKEREMLPTPQGEKEKEVRSQLCTRSALLEAQLYDTINAYTKLFIMNDASLPDDLRKKLNAELEQFNAQTTQMLTDKSADCVRRNASADQMAEELLEVFNKAAKKLAGDIDGAYMQASWYYLLHQFAKAGYREFRHVVEHKAGLCETCLSLSEQTFTLEELVQQELLPPLHPNCRCVIVPVYETGMDGSRTSGGFSSKTTNWPNGSGKTTLVKLLTQHLAPDSGFVRLGKNLEMAYFDQNREMLDPDKTLWRTLCGEGDHIYVRGHYRHVIAYLKDFLFTPDQAQSPVSCLSGGEKNRLMLALSLARESNFLVLDEPTNDLDMDTLDLLQEVLDEYEGTILLVSHDRDFLNKITTSMLYMRGDGSVIEHIGSYEELYDKYIARDGSFGRKAPAETKRQPYAVPKSGRSVSESVQSDSAIVPENSSQAKTVRLSYKDQRLYEILPDEIASIEQKIVGLEKELSDPGLYAADEKKFYALSGQLQQLQKEKDEKETQWLEIELLKSSL